MQSKECGEKRLYFNSDYLAGCHERILQSLIETNLIKAPGYGTDEFTLAAKKKILNACELVEGDVYFLVGGTQTPSFPHFYVLMRELSLPTPGTLPHMRRALSKYTGTKS